MRSLWTMKPLSIRSAPPVGGRDVVGVRMAADSGVAFEDGHVVGAVQHVRRGQAGDPGADNRRSRPRCWAQGCLQMSYGPLLFGAG